MRERQEVTDRTDGDRDRKRPGVLSCVRVRHQQSVRKSPGNRKQRQNAGGLRGALGVKIGYIRVNWGMLGVHYG